LLASEPSKVYHDGELQVIRGEGMPVHGRSFENGDLYVEWKVVMPDKLDLTPEKKNLLSQLLGDSHSTISTKRQKEEERRLENMAANAKKKTSDDDMSDDEGEDEQEVVAQTVNVEEEKRKWVRQCRAQ